MKKRLLPFLFFTLMGCVNEIDYLSSDEFQQPIVNCFFTTDSVFKIYVGKTSEIFSENSNYIDIKHIEIIDENNNHFVLNKQTNNLYISDIVAEENKNYKLEVETKNYGILNAESYIPSRIKIDTVMFNDNIYDDIFSELYSSVNIVFEDNPDEDNFYEISILGTDNILLYDNNDLTDTMYFLTHSDEIYSNDLLIEAEGYGNNLRFPYLLFSDRQADEENISVNVNFRLPIGSFYGDDFGNFFCDGSLLFVVKSVSKEYYEYRKSLILHNDELSLYINFDIFTNMLFVRKNIAIENNIEGGLGVFSGYNTNVFILHNPQIPTILW